MEKIQFTPCTTHAKSTQNSQFPRDLLFRISGIFFAKMLSRNFLRQCVAELTKEQKLRGVLERFLCKI
jgi:hypothetical protein